MDIKYSPFGCKQLTDDSTGGLLDECYQKVKEEVNKVLSTEGQFVCIASDAWSNVTNDPVVDYMAVSPTEEQGHDADWIATDLSRVIDSLGDNVVGAVSDNTATNKKAWSELENSKFKFAIDCKEVAAFFHNHHVPKAKLKKAQAAKLSGVVQPAPTRWGTLNGCFQSL
jgi:hypothetical protein